jgi:hypothetical protein
MSSNEPETGESTLDRRRILGAIGAAGATVASTGIASAAQPGIDEGRVAEIREPYNDIETVRRLLDDRQELLDAIAAAGYIDRASADGLGVETLGEPTSPTDTQVDVGVSTHTDELDADIRVLREFEAGRLHVSIKPDLDRAFAVFELEGGDSFEEVYTENIGDDISLGCVVCNKMTCTCTTPTGRLGKPDYGGGGGGGGGGW